MTSCALGEINGLASGLDAERHQLLAASQRVSSYRPIGQRRIACAVKHDVRASAPADHDDLGREASEFRARSVASSAELTRLADVERVLTADAIGLPRHLAQFWTAWAALANEPGALRARAEVLRRAAEVAKAIRQMAHDMAELEARESAPDVSYFVAALDELALNLARALESLQAQGYDLRGSTGVALFGGSRAAELTVRLLDPLRLAASAMPQHTLDGSNALRVSRLASSRSGPDAAYVALVAEVAERGIGARRRVTVQSAVSAGLDDLQLRLSRTDGLDRVTVLRAYHRALLVGVDTLPLVEDKIVCWLGDAVDRTCT